jgi:hypothetical protein
MKKFLLKILILSGIVCATIKSIETIVDKRLVFYSSISNEKTYFNPKHFESIIQYKLFQNRNRNISIIGSSRAAGFEKEMFHSKNIYNYSMIINSIEDIYNLIVDIDLKENDTLIIGLDQWNFNKNHLSRLESRYKSKYFKLPFLLFDDIEKQKDVYLIGEKAINNFSGFRNDGSYFYGKRYITDEKDLYDFLFKDSFDLIEKGEWIFNYGSEVDLNQINIIESILKYCKMNKIIVFGFSPPFAPSIVKKMNSSKYDYSYIDKSTKIIEQLFLKHRFYYKNFTNYNFYNDSFYLDGFHPNRNIYYKILKDLNIPVNTNFDNTKNINQNELKLLTKYFSN